MDKEHLLRAVKILIKADNFDNEEKMECIECYVDSYHNSDMRIRKLEAIAWVNKCINFTQADARIIINDTF